MKKTLLLVLAPAALVLLAVFSGCSYTAPYRRLASTEKAGGTAIVTFSQVEHRPGQRKAFFTDTKRVLAELPSQEGLLGYSFRFQLLGRKAWTMTAWKDEASRDKFARSGAHRIAARNSSATAQNMKFVSVSVPAESLPLSWAEGLKLLEGAPAY
jgi:heme-degrading monooxygenase HmoA